jgi:L-lactate dehydrogenase complex protein LldG
VSGARERILAAIGASLGPAEAATAAREAAMRAYIDGRAAGPRPKVEGPLCARFRERALRLASTVDTVDTLGAVTDAVARYLEQHALPKRAVVSPELATLDWHAAGIDVAARTAVDADLVGITGSFCAIAETGTLVLCSGDDTPGSVSLLPETHIAVLPSSRIVRGMEDAWALLGAELGSLPRSVNFVSGPSRTADIEQTLVLGAHGPYRVHVVVVGVKGSEW